MLRWRPSTEACATTSYLIAVCDGLVLQWLLDPDDTPDAEQLNTSLGIALFQAIEDVKELMGGEPPG